VERSQPAPDLTALQRLLPERSGVVVYTRAATPPWELCTTVGDGPGVVGLPNQTLRQVWWEIVHPDDQPALAQALATLGPGESVAVDYRVRTPNGGERWLRDSTHRLAGRHGILVGTLRDVSVERTLRSQIAALEERIWQAQRVDSLGALAAGIAHDLGNLMTAVVSAVQLVEESEGIPRGALEDLAVARESARRGAEFVKQILRFAARDGYRPGPVDVNAILEDLRVILGRSLGTDVRLVLTTEPKLPRIQCDLGQMEQVLLNLAVNAREAMPGGGKLTIATRLRRLSHGLSTPTGTLSPGDYVVLSVSDTGRGIPEEVGRRIFEPFFSTKAHANSGCGFGLSTVQRIVHAHGGGVDMETAEGEGTSFHIYMPVRSAGAVAELGGARQSIREAERPGRILVVEADPSVREVMRRVLARAGYAVLALESARDTLRIFDRIRPRFDLLVTGVVLPDRSGLELARLLRNRAPRLGVVYVAGDAGQVELLEGDDPDIARLDKPFTSRQLLAAVERAVRSVPGGAVQADGSTGT
jgi:two-component system, cell cycle sensor histidine kinase and response regulator CckA